MAALDGMDEQTSVASRVILVVEDDPDICLLLKSIIEEEGPYQVMLARNGLQAADMMKRTRPDLFLFDYQLPIIDGLELYQRLHAIREFVAIPVLFISAYAPKDVFEKEHLPYMRKPFRVDELLQQVEMLLAG